MIFAQKTTRRPSFETPPPDTKKTGNLKPGNVGGWSNYDTSCAWLLREKRIIDKGVCITNSAKKAPGGLIIAGATTVERG